MYRAGEALMAATLHVLGVALEISSDTPSLVAPFLDVFGAFQQPAKQSGLSAPSGGKRVTAHISAAAGTFEVNGASVRLVAGALRVPQVYNLLYRTLVRALEGVYLLHAAVVAASGRAWLISGPSGSGKTSLGRALLQRGFGFLSDDLAPLGVDGGQIHPFPRRLGIDPATWQGTAAPPGIRLGDKQFVGAEELGIPVVRDVLPPGAIVLMNPYDDDGTGRVHMTLGLAGGAATLAARLQAMPGIEVARRGGQDGLEILELELVGSEAIAAAQREVDRMDADLLFHSRGYGTTKTYAITPSIEPIPVQEAALGLLRETLNREPSSALMRRHAGKLTAALFELTGLLADVPCYALRPGGIEVTADLLATTFGQIAGDT